MNRINGNQIETSWSLRLPYFLAIDLGVLVGNLVDHHKEIRFMRPSFCLLLWSITAITWKNQSNYAIFLVGCVDRSFFFLFSRHGAGMPLFQPDRAGSLRCLFQVVKELSLWIYEMPCLLSFWPRRQGPFCDVVLSTVTAQRYWIVVNR